MTSCTGICFHGKLLQKTIQYLQKNPACCQVTQTKLETPKYA